MKQQTECGPDLPMVLFLLLPSSHEENLAPSNSPLVLTHKHGCVAMMLVASSEGAVKDWERVWRRWRKKIWRSVWTPQINNCHTFNFVAPNLCESVALFKFCFLFLFQACRRMHTRPARTCFADFQLFLLAINKEWGQANISPCEIFATIQHLCWLHVAGTCSEGCLLLFKKSYCMRGRLDAAAICCWTTQPWSLALRLTPGIHRPVSGKPANSRFIRHSDKDCMLNEAVSPVTHFQHGRLTANKWAAAWLRWLCKMPPRGMSISHSESRGVRGNHLALAALKP